MSLATRIKAHLANNGRPMTAREITTDLAANGNTVRRVIGELMNAGIVVPQGCDQDARFAPTTYGLVPEQTTSEGADAHQG